MALVWGIPYVMIKIAVGGVSAPDVVFCRTAVGALVLWPVAVRGGGMLTTLRRHGWWMLVFAVCEIVGPWWLLSDAERKLPSSLTGLLIAAVPIISALFVLFSGSAERLGVTRWLGLLIGLGGVAVLAVPHLGGGDTWSIAEVMLTAIGYAIAPSIAATKLRDVPGTQLTAACLTLAALVFVGPAIVTRPHALPSTSVLVSLAGLAIVCTALAFLLFFRLIAEVGPSRAVVFTYVNPVVSVLAGAVVLGEPVTVLTIVGFVFILAGSLLATRKSRTAVTEPTDPVTAIAEG
jgi:drug/metabolite transporter (DMT)-like permease